MRVNNSINYISNRNKNNKKNTSFKSSMIFLNYNDKFNSIQNKVYDELTKFANGQNNVSILGEGKFGETYRFKDSSLRNVVIKKSKGEYKDDYIQEYNNLIEVPTKKVGGQAGIARAYNFDTKEHFLLSTMAEGKEISRFNRYTDNHLKSLFDKMYELDKVGLYHGDLNGKNILLTNKGEINFIDYQWAQVVNKINFFDKVKSEKLLLPLSHFPENAQMFEMATMPYYIQSIGSKKEKEAFLKMYLRNKSGYHFKRAQYIEKLLPNWQYSNEIPLLKAAIKTERAKAKVYKNPSDNILKIELKKFQFLSDYRDAFGHVDPHIFERNILTSSSSYLCSISAVQDYRKEIANQLKTCKNADMTNYLKSQLQYGDYWFDNLKKFSSDTFDYVMRTITKNMRYDEEIHSFYQHDRNPRLMKPNRNVLEAVDSRFKTIYDKNFSVPYNLKEEMHEIFSEPMDEIKSFSKITNPKAYHRRKKIQHAYGKLKTFERNGKILDLLNTSEVIALKTREFHSYANHNMHSYKLLILLNTMFERAVELTENLHSTILNGLNEQNAQRILVQGYENMRKFITKI